ncbi:MULTISPECIES: sugar-binding transcriptional regulator [Ochrobactrum]|uniref:Sugar-binding transcriptional regulator n=1 Tax=Ochrobactrum quorumnocens TaxID=271865 RepID=A0A5N1JZ45_9HYPH|nr:MULTISPECIES: sugar-binding domain-containing protein [Brucella/Ochrobactrum group]KAA9368620.1 sugar-binding transcriptional regulator [[Ochrobactrum] quorumnocens]MBD7989758.1 sugar-binding transcriptional regulator [Ochrobactrum gallinarum]MCV9909436.1 sugar-binding transcriptional regulator [Brucella sp. HL-2]MDH7791122.1 DNA-binding transcriptional regulator LsrR (DeoR family) [Ochrobactrum sp. AN78]
MNEKFVSVDEEQERARVAWLYFIGGQTQQEIAQRLNITRLKVNKIIGQVRESGQIQISVSLPLSDCVELAEKVAARYGLADAVVVPDLDDFLEQKRVIGEAAGTMAGELIDGRDMGVGIASGRTLSFAVRSLRAKPKPESWVVGLTGGVTSGSSTNTFEVATDFARALGVECHYLTAPIYCANRESRNAILLSDELTDVLARTEIADIGLVSCGPLTSETSLTHIRVVKDNLDAVLKLGAVGEFLGYFLDAQGRPIDHFLNDSIIALPPDKLKLKPASVLVSGGLNKIPIIRAILRGGYVNRLVTNEGVARALLQGPR